MTCLCESDALIFKGKRPSELTHQEAIDAANYFRSITVKQFNQLTAMVRRISKLEEAVSKDEIKKLDFWLKNHSCGDVYRGDGAPYYTDWRKYDLPQPKDEGVPF